MLNLLGNLRKHFNARRVHIDGNVFRLYTSATVAFLLGFCTLLTAREYVGTPIDCHCPTMPAGVVNSFCWVESTFSHRSLFNASYNDSVIYPGTGHRPKGSGSEDRKYHTYYQWVCFLLFAQAVCFYAPRWLWKAWEGGKVAAIVAALDIRAAVTQNRAEVRSQMADFLVVSLNHNRCYLVKYLICELLSVLNVIVQAAFTDYVLGGSFLTYGWDLVRWHRSEGREFVSPAVMAFPRIAMCTFLKYGQSGTLENLEAICVLPLNILNEKLFAFLWFWYLLLLLLGVPAIAYRVLLLVSAPLRRRLLGWRYPDSQRISAVVSSLSAGDVFLLSLVGQNVDSLVFSQLVAELSRRLVKLLPAVPSAPPLL
ncbi:innexin shaking-B-like [Haemaphysalis longicornis]